MEITQARRKPVSYTHLDVYKRQVQGRYIIRCASVQMKAKSLVDPVVKVVFVQFHSQVTYVFDQTICHSIDVILLCVSALQQSRRYKQVHEPDFR